MVRLGGEQAIRGIENAGDWVSWTPRIFAQFVSAGVVSGVMAVKSVKFLPLPLHTRRPP
jgi:hypothetical protein